MARLIQPSFAGGEVSASVAARVDLSKRAVAVEQAENFIAKFTGGMDSRPGQRFVARAKSNGQVRLLPFEFNTKQTYVLEVGNEYMRFHAQGGQIVEAGKAVTAATSTTITVVGHGYTTGEEVYLAGLGGITNLEGRNVIVTVIDADTFTISDLNGSPIVISGTYISGGESFRVYEISTPYDADDIFDLEYAQSGDVLTIVHPSYAPRELVRITNTDWTLTEISFDPVDHPFADGAGFWPGTTGFYQQRQIYANSETYPNRFWMTKTGDFYDFAISDPLRDDDAIIATIAARRINEIRHTLPLSDLLIMTSGAEFRVKGAGDAAFTPSTINIKPQSFYGSTSLRPIVAGDVALFASPGQFIREISYEFATDKFTGRDLSVLARHLVDNNELIDWSFSQSPYSIVWAVRDDGIGLVLTYQKEQEVYAWTRATTNGLYKSVTTVREGDVDAVYLLVQREIAGNQVSFIERVDDRKFDNLADAFCVDAGLSLDEPITITNMTAADPVVVTAPAHGLSDGDIVDISDVYEVTDTDTQRQQLSEDYSGTGFVVANTTLDTFELQNAGANYDGSGFAVYSSGGVVRKAVTTLTGLWHLEGASVVAAANGYAQTGITVSDGSITLNEPASRVHVGLAYTCRLVTLPLATYSEGETIQGRPKNITSLTVQVERTMGMWAGPTTDQMREAKFGLPDRWNQPLKMITDDIDVTIKADWDKKKQLVIEQRSPLPMTVLALVPDITLGSR